MSAPQFTHHCGTCSTDCDSVASLRSELAEARRALSLLWEEANDGSRAFLGVCPTEKLERAFAYSAPTAHLVSMALARTAFHEEPKP